MPTDVAFYVGVSQNDLTDAMRDMHEFMAANNVTTDRIITLQFAAQSIGITSYRMCLVYGPPGSRSDRLPTREVETSTDPSPTLDVWVTDGGERRIEVMRLI